MELELRLRHRRWRSPHWQAAAVAGFAAGAVLMVLELAWAAATSLMGPWRTPHLVAAIMLGPEQILGPGGLDFSAGVVIVAMAVHYALGITFGVALSIGIAVLHLEHNRRATLLFGALFGVLLYLANFHAGVAIFPWLRELQGWATAIAHLVFGLSAALLYGKLAFAEGRS